MNEVLRKITNSTTETLATFNDSDVENDFNEPGKLYFSTEMAPIQSVSQRFF